MTTYFSGSQFMDFNSFLLHFVLNQLTRIGYVITITNIAFGNISLSTSHSHPTGNNRERIFDNIKDPTRICLRVKCYLSIVNLLFEIGPRDNGKGIDLNCVPETTINYPVKHLTIFFYR